MVIGVFYVCVKIYMYLMFGSGQGVFWARLLIIIELNLTQGDPDFGR